MAKVKVTNLSRGTVVLDRAEVAGTFFTRMKGLLGRSRLSPARACCSNRPTLSILSG